MGRKDESRTPDIQISKGYSIIETLCVFLNCRKICFCDVNFQQMDSSSTKWIAMCMVSMLIATKYNIYASYYIHVLKHKRFYNQLDHHVVWYCLRVASLECMRVYLNRLYNVSDAYHL